MGGIPRLAPQALAGLLQCLPPILYTAERSPMPGYSKAPRGLSVFLRVTSIFAGATISPSPSLRQRWNRYAFHAGRVLSDEEFRYHRTVIVTAVVHQGFSSEPGPKTSPFPLTVWHRTGVGPYTSACALAETCVFGKQSPQPFLCGHTMLNKLTS